MMGSLAEALSVQSGVHHTGDASGSHASSVFTSAQLHMLADQIKALRQISLQLYCLKNLQCWARAKAATAVTNKMAVSSAPNSNLSSQTARKGARQGKKRADVAPKGKAAAGPKKRSRLARDESEEDIATSISDTSMDTDDGEDDGPSAPTPRRQSQRRRSAVKSLKDEDSDEGEDHIERSTARASKGPIRLPQFEPQAFDRGSAGDDVQCDVCGDSEQAEGNAILLCDGPGCSVAVHQGCYGLVAIPEGDWLCDGCTAGLDPRTHHCIVCPVSGGVLRPVASLGAAVPPQGAASPDGRFWAHLACALWMPDVDLAEPERMAGLQLTRLAPDRDDLECMECRQKGGGIVQCCFGVCWRGFHVMCARAAGNLLAFRHSDGTPLLFCGLHSRSRFERTRQTLIAGDAARAAAGGESEDEPDAGPNEYELQRLRNIERNRRQLAALRGGQDLE